MHIVISALHFEWGSLDECFARSRRGFGGTFCVEFPVRGDLGPFRACVRELRERFA